MLYIYRVKTTIILKYNKIMIVLQWMCYIEIDNTFVTIYFSAI